MTCKLPRWGQNITLFYVPSVKFSLDLILGPRHFDQQQTPLSRQLYEGVIGLSLERPYLMQGQKLMYQESDHNPL